MSRYILWPENRDRILENCVRELLASDPKTAIEVSIKPYKQTRSDEQNAALWGVAYPPLVAHTGFTADEIHEVMCMGYFGRTAKLVMNTATIRPLRTTTTNQDGEREVLSASEFSAFYAYVQRRGAEIGLDIPDPDPMRGAA